MATYLIYRVGANADNQPMTHRRPVAIVDAPNRRAAEALTWGERPPSLHDAPTLAAPITAAVDALRFWHNQHAEAIPQSRARTSDWNAVIEQDAERAAADAAEAPYWAALEQDAAAYVGPRYSLP